VAPIVVVESVVEVVVEVPSVSVADAELSLSELWVVDDDDELSESDIDPLAVSVPEFEALALPSVAVIVAEVVAVAVAESLSLPLLPSSPLHASPVASAAAPIHIATRTEPSFIPDVCIEAPG
jgi:hypothetical protein